MGPIFFDSPAAWRAWLEAHHAEAREVLVGFRKRHTGEAGLTWPQAVDEALCFGWIDSVRQRIDDRSYSNRFTPRKPGSTWSQVNIRRVEELTAGGRMAPAGLAAFATRDPARRAEYSYEAAGRALDAAYETELLAQPEAWAFFQAQAPSYRRAASWWVMSAKQEATRRRRLAALIADSAAGRRLAHLTPRP